MAQHLQLTQPRRDRVIGQRIRSARLRHPQGLTQQAIADTLGVHKCTVSQWERGVQPLRASMADELAILLYISVQELLADLPDEPRRVGPLHRTWSAARRATRHPPTEAELTRIFGPA